MKKVVPVPEGITLEPNAIMQRYMVGLIYKKYSGILAKMYDMEMDSIGELLGLTKKERVRCRELADKIVEEAEKAELAPGS